MLKNALYVFIIICFCLINSLISVARPVSASRVLVVKGIVSFSYGTNGGIKYNLNSGTLSVYVNNKVVLTNVYSAAKYNADSVSTKNYSIRKYSKSAIADGFGKGEKHVITLSGKGLPEMKQIFYTYPLKQGFFIEIELAGKKLESNYMAPVIGDFLPMTGDVRTILVPFDNDTFISYDARPLTAVKSNEVSAEVGTVYNNMSRTGIVAGSVEHGVWKTGVQFTGLGGSNQVKVWAGYTQLAVTRDEVPHGLIKGDIIHSPRIMVGYFADWRNGLEEYGKANRIADPPYVANWTKPTPVGWNSWGVMQEKLTYEKATKVADFFADSLKSFRIGGTAYIDLDSYWDSMVKGHDYSRLKQFADYCKSKGLQPGIYWAPFTDWGWKGGPDRKVEGGDYTYGQLWTKTGEGYHEIDGARAIDPTHPGTLKRIDYFTDIFKACGFKMIKIDFLGHAAAESTHFYDTNVTTGMQAYRKGMEYLIDKLGNDMLIYAAISPSLATGRYVHARRIACDAFKTIEHTRYTLNSVTYGWWQTWLYNYVDADHVVLDHQTEGENRARMLSAIITGTFITGDDFSEHGQWSARAQAWYQNSELLKVVQNGKAFMPVESNTDKNASSMFTRKIGNYLYLAIFNYNKDPKTIKIEAQRIGLSEGKVYQGVELLHDKDVKLNGALNQDVAAADALFIKLKLN
jgi:alpha-galactosidase